MAAIHAALQSVVKYFNTAKASTHVNDVRPSKVQYKFVFGALLTCAILSGLTTWFSRIDCAISDANLVDKRYIEEWCYANSTFLVKETQGGFVVGNQYSSTSESVFHVGYYQWVTLALLFQAACFQIPRLLWKSLEGGRVRRMVGHLANSNFAVEEQRKSAIRIVASHYVNQNRSKSYKHYFTHFAFCQCLYFINALFQIGFAQSFLNHEFLNLLPSFLRGSPRWNQIFPKLVKCSFLLHGPSGSPQTMDVLCVLAMNILFEKLYLVVWGLLAVALAAAIAQIFFISQHMIASSSLGSERKDLPALLLLEFLKLSLDAALYADLVDEIRRLEAQVV